MITFYKSQWRDPLVVGDYIADSSFIDGRKIYHCRDFKGDGEMLIYATDTNFQVVASSPIAYWYTLDKIDGINIYMPDVDRNMENEIRGKYSFSHSSTAEYLTIINYSREVLMTLKRK